MITLLYFLLIAAAGLILLLLISLKDYHIEDYLDTLENTKENHHEENTTNPSNTDSTNR